jgi:hypothetical protein
MSSATELLNLVISATDRASSVIGGINGKLAGLGNTAKDVQGKSSGVGDSIAFGMIKAEAAIGMVSAAYEKLTGAISDASTIQLSNMAAAQSFSAISGRSFEEGSSYIPLQVSSSAAWGDKRLYRISSDNPR